MSFWAKKIFFQVQKRKIYQDSTREENAESKMKKLLIDPSTSKIISDKIKEFLLSRLPPS